METSEARAIKAWAWYESVKDGKYERFNLECNKSAIFTYLDSMLEQIKPETIVAAFAAAEGNGNKLPNGFQLAVKTNPQIAEEAAAKRAAADAQSKKDADALVLAQENRRFELIEWVSKHRGATTPEALRLEKSIISHWPDAKLEQEAAAIRLRQQSRGQSAAEFSKAQGLDRIDSTGKEIKKSPGAVPLPENFTARVWQRMTNVQMRLFVKGYVTKGYDDRAVWHAINQRVAETAGQEN
jgi:hypothetical protein